MVSAALPPWGENRGAVLGRPGRSMRPGAPPTPGGTGSLSQGWWSRGAVNTGAPRAPAWQVLHSPGLSCHPVAPEGLQGPRGGWSQGVQATRSILFHDLPRSFACTSQLQARAPGNTSVSSSLPGVTALEAWSRRSQPRPHSLILEGRVAWKRLSVQFPGAAAAAGQGKPL